MDIADAERYNRRRFRGSLWTPDRGTGFYQTERQKKHRAYLVETGRHAGRSRVKLKGIDLHRLKLHIWKRDFFTSVASLELKHTVLIMFLMYSCSFVLWAVVYYVTWKGTVDCFSNFTKFIDAFIFSMVTQQTIGYGVRAPTKCWIVAWEVMIHSVCGLLLDAMFLGIIFARISHPKQRGRTIFISDTAVIARRDGILKFMFRIADIRHTTVLDPKVKVHLYTWGQGRSTTEGEHIPVKMEEISIDCIDGMLLLPLVLEHTIDERSPLYGHTDRSLESLQAEIVVTFVGTNEMGNSFMARQSYLPSEIHWGHVFVNMLEHAPPGETHHVADLSRFHDVEPQEGFGTLPPNQLTKKVLGGSVGAGKVPYPLLGENTFVISSCACVAPRNGVRCLMFRVGDTYPNQMLQVTVRAYLYRWKGSITAEGEHLPYDIQELDLGYSEGRDRLLLRLPVTVAHVIDAASPVAHWMSQEEMMKDATSEITVVLDGTMYKTGNSMLRSRTYSVLHHLRWDHVFAPCVATASRRARPGTSSAPLTSSHRLTLALEVDWQRFHDVAKIRGAGEEAESRQGKRSVSEPGQTPPLPTIAEAAGGQGSQSMHGTGASGSGRARRPGERALAFRLPSADTGAWTGWGSDGPMSSRDSESESAMSVNGAGSAQCGCVPWLPPRRAAPVGASGLAGTDGYVELRISEQRGGDGAPSNSWQWRTSRRGSEAYDGSTDDSEVAVAFHADASFHRSHQATRPSSYSEEHYGLQNATSSSLDWAAKRSLADIKFDDSDDNS